MLYRCRQATSSYVSSSEGCEVESVRPKEEGGGTRSRSAGIPICPRSLPCLQPTGYAIPRFYPGPGVISSESELPPNRFNQQGERLTTRVLGQGVRTPLTGRRCRAWVPEPMSRPAFARSFPQLLLPTNNSYLAQFMPLPNGPGVSEWRVA